MLMRRFSVLARIVCFTGIVCFVNMACFAGMAQAAESDLSATSVPTVLDYASKDYLGNKLNNDALDNIAIGVLPYNSEQTGQPATGQALSLPARQIILQHMYQKGLISAEELATRKQQLSEQGQKARAGYPLLGDQRGTTQPKDGNSSEDDRVKDGSNRVRPTDVFTEDPFEREALGRRGLRNDERDDWVRERRDREDRERRRNGNPEHHRKTPTP